MDLILRGARLVDRDGVFDIGIDKTRIAAIEPKLAAEGPEIDVAGRLVSPGFVETHIHLDKSCILDRCKADTGDLDEAIRGVAAAKRSFTPEDVYRRAQRTLEKCILNGTTHVRTHLEVDPGIGLRGLEGVLPLIADYKMGRWIWRSASSLRRGFSTIQAPTSLWSRRSRVAARWWALHPTRIPTRTDRSTASSPWPGSSTSTSTCISTSGPTRRTWTSTMSANSLSVSDTGAG